MTHLQRCGQLYAALFGTWKGPKRASRMTGRADQAHKYVDIPNYSFGPEHFAAHMAGRDTYAGTLGLLGEARSGCKDYDNAGEAEIVAALAAAATKGITAAAFLLPGSDGEHTGGHIWTFYDRLYPESDIRAQLRTIPRSRKGEDYPSGNPVRFPFGYHKRKKTRGELVFQDGRRFRLDEPSQLIAGIDALLSLPRNGKPEPAASGDVRTSGAAWGEAYKPDEWESLPDGGPLWHSAYVAEAARRGRPDLAKLLRGERVTLVKKDDTRDDSDSAQVAALAYNLSSADVDRQQARAIADYLYPQLRPGRTREHYRAHFDTEWERYLPKHYRPQVIRCLGPSTSATPAALPPAEYKPEPKSRARKDRPQKVTGPAGYLAWLRTQVDPQSDSVMLSQSQCAARLGCCIRTIKRYEKALAGHIERRVFARRQAGCLFILAPDVVTTLPANVVIADREIEQQHAENAEPATMQEEHTPPVVPSPLIESSAADDFDDAEVDRMVLEIQAAQADLETFRKARFVPHFALAVHASERHEPQHYWERHESRAWREDHPIAPEAPAAATKRQRQAERNKARLRDKWDAMTPGQLGRELAVLRNYLKSHPAAQWPRWQISELNDRLAEVTPVEESQAQQADTRGACVPPQPTPEPVQMPLSEGWALVEKLRARQGAAHVE